MYRVLFKIGFFEIESYYVFWSIALIAAILWTNKRIDRSGLPAKEASSVISYAFFGMILGARCFEYFLNWRLYFENPSFFLDINRGGISEVGAALGAIIVAFIMCKVKNVSFWKLSEMVSPAGLLTVAIGRWGCYLEGCCRGIDGRPTQLYYSFSAAIILSIVLTIENYIKRNGIIFKYGIVSPVSVGLYSVMRLFIDPYRIEANTQGIIMSDKVLAVSAAVCLVWLTISFMKKQKLKENA
ncbi:MAG: prolipoprotein diacylglyceryl transferase [Synergistaceae bacterium]|nr:prolipoprotein diacylglyceryl transferase [Synergistaceae bacterium]